jgi:acetyl esterase/lipase
MYDAIVVGARCAGSPTAMLLARKGYRVLLVDKAPFPSDTIPLLIQVGSDELLRDDSTQVAQRARAAGVLVTLHIGEEMWHGWHSAAVRTPFPEGQVALREIADFVDQLSGNVRS